MVQVCTIMYRHTCINVLCILPRPILGPLLNSSTNLPPGTNRVSRWALLLSQQECTIEYCQTSKHSNVDALRLSQFHEAGPDIEFDEEEVDEEDVDEEDVDEEEINTHSLTQPNCSRSSSKTNC